MRGWVAMAFVVLACTRCIAQADIHIAEPSERFPASWYPPDSDVTYTVAPETGAPYTATLVSTGHSRNPQTGEMTESKVLMPQMRDSEGREREEHTRPYPDGHGGVMQVRYISVSDPVSHCSFEWTESLAPTEESKVATVRCNPRTLHYSPPSEPLTETKETRTPAWFTRREPLPERTIAGLRASGIRASEGKINAQGEEMKPLVTEAWFATDLKAMLLIKTISTPDGSTQGWIDMELTDIRRGEPDRSLFYPPPGYTIQRAR